MISRRISHALINHARSMICMVDLTEKGSRVRRREHAVIVKLLSERKSSSPLNHTIMLTICLPLALQILQFKLETMLMLKRYSRRKWRASNACICVGTPPMVLHQVMIWLEGCKRWDAMAEDTQLHYLKVWGPLKWQRTWSQTTLLTMLQ